ncbi:OsmC family peroxiredoxin [Sphingobacteriales bacterium CHB3]|nr:OsmC family peroxiredoxin [Sphingobacteriales bacterium CHB3]
MKRSATAVWNGSGKEGKGVVSVQSGFIKNQAYTYASRFENAVGTNPEELVAAAHAGCFAMKLSFVLGAAGFTPDALNVTCTVNLEQGAIIESHLELKAKVPSISAEKFAECANEAKATCPISKSLTAKITLDAKLEG